MKTRRGFESVFINVNDLSGADLNPVHRPAPGSGGGRCAQAQIRLLSPGQERSGDSSSRASASRHGEGHRRSGSRSISTAAALCCTAPQVYEGIKNGITDIGYSHIEYTPGRFPRSAPPASFRWAIPAVGWPTRWPMISTTNSPKTPRSGTTSRCLWMHSSPPNILITTKPVRKMEDLKGMVIRAPGMVGKIVSALGATPAPTPVMESL